MQTLYKWRPPYVSKSSRFSNIVKNKSSSVDGVQNGSTFGERPKQFLYLLSYGTEDADTRATSVPCRIKKEHCWTSSPLVCIRTALFSFSSSLFCYCGKHSSLVYIPSSFFLRTPPSSSLPSLSPKNHSPSTSSSEKRWTSQTGHPPKKKDAIRHVKHPHIKNEEGKTIGGGV